MARMTTNNTLSFVVILALLNGCAAPPAPALPPQPAGFRQPDPRNHPELYVWTDTCNVYVVKDGEDALLVDLGDGSVLEHLAEIGVQRVEWVLFTHHHREQ